MKSWVLVSVLLGLSLVYFEGCSMVRDSAPSATQVERTTAVREPWSFGVYMLTLALKWPDSERKEILVKYELAHVADLQSNGGEFKGRKLENLVGKGISNVRLNEEFLVCKWTEGRLSLTILEVEESNVTLRYRFVEHETMADGTISYSSGERLALPQWYWFSIPWAMPKTSAAVDKRKLIDGTNGSR